MISPEIMKGTRVFLIIMACFNFTACFPSIAGKGHREIVDRTSSPGGHVQAVVEMSDGGATTSRGYSVYFVPIGVNLNSEVNRDRYRMAVYDGALINGTYGINVHWESLTEAVVSFDKVQKSILIRTAISIDDVVYTIRKSANIGTE